MPELLRQARKQDADLMEAFPLGLGETTRFVPAAESGSPGESDGPPRGDLRQDRVGQLVKRVLGGVTSDEIRRAYGHALDMLLAFCDRESDALDGRNSSPR